MKSVMSHTFSQVPKAEIQRSRFDRSHGYKTTFDSGYLVPFYVDEVLPGDTFNLDATTFARLATQIVPVMDNMYMDTFFFYVPSRLLWNHWTNFNGEQVNPDDSTDYLVPTISAKTGFAVGSLADYLGIPTDVSGLTVNALPFRAYAKVWDDWFRDENLQDSILSNSTFFGDGPDDPDTLNKLRKRGKRHDYFTSALPWPQKGPGVELPLGSTAPVYGDGTAAIWQCGKTTTPNTLKGYMASQTTGSIGMFQQSSSSEPPLAGDNSITLDNNDRFATRAYNLVRKELGQDSHVYADLTEATAVTINSLRQAFAIQRWYERAARGGTRYTEILKSFFGVTSPDSRLQRSEYLGGNSTPVQVNTVAQTAATDSNSPQANLAAYSTVSGRSGFTKSFVEHGYVIGLVNVRCDLNYQQGLNRMWSRQTRFDYYWPQLAHLGEQAILNKEIYAQGNNVKDGNGDPIDDQPFGYQERYAEYRYHPSQITGKLRSTYAQTLDYWHLAQKFEDLPKLNSEFIEENPPINRIIAVQDEPQFVFDSYISCKCVRPMPVYGVPGLMDHF